MSAPSELAAQLADPARLGRLLTRVENDPAERARVLAGLPRSGEDAYRIGITGAPGVGKSTLLARLVPILSVGEGLAPSRSNAGSSSGEPITAGGYKTPPYKARPALIAIDPTSAQTGGAVLADRFRWNELAASGVFVRSLASRGSLGGTSAAAQATLRVLAAAGYDPLVIETVGVGQTGAEIRALADTVVVLLSPESGDALQLLKAGLLELGDIIVVNKADRPGADALLTELKSALQEAHASGWQRPVIYVSALNGDGIAELAESIREHRAWHRQSPPVSSENMQRLQLALETALRSRMEDEMAVLLRDHPEVLNTVAADQSNLDAAVEELLALLKRS